MTVFALQEGPRTQRIDIGDGLIMRWSTKADADDVGALLSEAFRWEPFGPPVPAGTAPGPNEVVRASGRRLLRGNSAVMTEYDYALVENTRAQPGECPLVACACLHAVPGYYGSVQLQYGKLEVIATHPDYRNKGLIRRLLLEMIHPASDERGDLIQFIQGIPHFYLQFGYTYALRTGERRTRIPSLDLIPQPRIQAGETEAFYLRSVTLADIPYLVRMSTPDRLCRDGTQLVLVFDEAYWKFTTHDVYETKQSIFDASRQTRIIVDTVTGKDVGMAKSRYDHPEAPPEDSLIDHLIIDLGSHHPASLILEPLVRPGDFERLYTRIPSYTQFLVKVAPVLEERLSRSALMGVSGSLSLDFFKRVEGSSGRGLRMTLEHGKIISVQDWVPPTPQERMMEDRRRLEERGMAQIQKKEYSASLAPLSFTRLVTGEISVDQLLEQFGENSVKDSESRLLLDVLFPTVQHHFSSLWW
ncbi:hypothetical protein KVV02_000755 [Mortierella alpina]|uniref:Uncharacterized protein n=1 Tax=Mortierella alpina TaxID=64518 RepID=A0A9P8A8V8_MORAP|nr:hypothetical protein KVV02_000755 [Mortierella alpina]